MEGFTEISKLFKERENPKAFSVEIGTIINTFPDIKIKLGDEGKIILTKENIFFASSVIDNYKRNCVIDAQQTLTGTIVLKEYLKVEDQVILIPTPDNQKYYLIDKVVEL